MQLFSIKQFISQKEYQLVLSRNLKERVMESASFLCGFIQDKKYTQPNLKHLDEETIENLKEEWMSWLMLYVIISTNKNWV